MTKVGGLILCNAGVAVLVFYKGPLCETTLQFSPFSNPTIIIHNMKYEWQIFFIEKYKALITKKSILYLTLLDPHLRIVWQPWVFIYSTNHGSYSKGSNNSKCLKEMWESKDQFILVLVNVRSNDINLLAKNFTKNKYIYIYNYH